jgi:hypothetical protein
MPTIETREDRGRGQPVVFIHRMAAERAPIVF